MPQLRSPIARTQNLRVAPDQPGIKQKQAAHLSVMAFVKAMGTLTGKMMAAGAASVGAVGAYQWSQVRSPHPQTLSEPVPPC